MRLGPTSKQALFSLLAVALALVAIEGLSWLAIRVLFGGGAARPPTVVNLFHPLLGHVARPGARVDTSRPWRDRRDVIEIDGDGRSVTPLTAPPPRLEIAITGGSVVFGVGASSNATTIPSRLERLIHERLGVPVEVTNLGALGYQSFNELLAAHLHLSAAPVDLVLSLGGRNDAWIAWLEPEPEAAFLRRSIWRRVVPAVRRLEGGRPVVAVSEWLRSRLYTARLGYLLLQPLQPPDPPPDEALARRNLPQRVALTVTHYRLLEARARQAGAPYALFLQPTAYTRDPLTQEERGQVLASHGGDSEASAAQSAFERDYLAATAREMTVERFYDLRGLFDDAEGPVFVDTCHLDDAGNLAVAEAIFDRVRPLLEEAVARRPGLGPAAPPHMPESPRTLTVAPDLD